jgi:HD superfamily phosphohydrolase
MTLPKKKTIGDPIHGFMEFEPEVVKFIDTPQVQRLRYLHQLGTSYYVFPSASHTRFEHSLGVSHIANQLILKLTRDQPELNITPKDRQLVSLAGLCHDLGHGPFSHIFEDWINSNNSSKFSLKSSIDPLEISPSKWNHEEMSVKMLQFLIDENNLDYEKSEINVITDLIIGSKNSTFFEDKPFLYDIIHNSTNGIDVDKFDYLGRDSYHLGLKSSYDYKRLFHSVRIIDNQICYNEKDVYSIYSLFSTRYNLHKQVYRHRVTSAIDYMVRDMLTEANSSLKIMHRAHDVSKYLRLTDSILSEISLSEDSSLNGAKKILSRIENRNIYKMAIEKILPRDRWLSLSRHLTSEKLASMISSNPDNLIVSFYKINYSMEGSNPVLSVPFYSDSSMDSSPFIIPSSEVSLLLPTQFEEFYCRIFVRDSLSRKSIKDNFNSIYSQLF